MFPSFNGTQFGKINGAHIQEIKQNRNATRVEVELNELVEQLGFPEKSLLEPAEVKIALLSRLAFIVRTTPAPTTTRHY